MTAIESYRNQPLGNESDTGGETFFCVCCDQEVSDLDLFCHQCNVPAEVSKSVASRDVQADFISVLGASNAGKTVYLGLLLDMLGSRCSPIRGSVQGTFSISLQEQVVNALGQCRFPEKTPTESDLWKWLHCEVSWAKSKKSIQHIDFVAPDFAGEAIAGELEQTGSYPAIRNVVSRSCGILLLCDSAEVRDSGPREDLFALKIASYIADLHRHSKQSTHPAIAVVFTKSDTCQDAEDDPDRFAQNNMPRFIDFCTRKLPQHRFFAASVIGASCTITGDKREHCKVPLHIQPRGVIEPLQWLVGQS